MTEREAELTHKLNDVMQELGKTVSVALHHERKIELAIRALAKGKPAMAATLLEQHLNNFKLFEGDLLHDSVSSSS